MYKAFCRVGDKIEGTCKGSGADHPRSCTGVWKTGSNILTADGIPVVREGIDVGETDCGHSFFGIAGNRLTTSAGIPVMTVGDEVNIQGGTGKCVTGSGSSAIG